jgi:hypothetical protein
MVLGLLLAGEATLNAQELPHLEFVRALRAKQYPDLALEYLEKLNADPSRPQDPLLLLELAKTRLDLAALESDPNRRLPIYQQATTDLTTFLTKFPDHPLVADAKREKAQLISTQGKALLSKVQRADASASRTSDAAAARALFAQASKDLDAVAAEIETQRAKYTGEPKNEKEKEERQALEQARIQVELDQGLNFLDQALSYLDDGTTKTLEARAAVVKNAENLLTKAAAHDSKSPLCWQAKAWAGLCYMEMGDPKKARQKLNEVINETGKYAEPGKRLARYFLMRLTKESPDGKEDPAVTIQKRAEEWLTDYKPYVKTPEGYGVRYLLAEAHFSQARDVKELAKKQDHLNQARRLCRELERGDHDYTVKAQRIKIGIIQAEGGFDKSVDSLKNFDDCVVRAQHEAFQIEEEAKIPPKNMQDAEKKRKERQQTITSALTRALSLAEKDPKIAPEDVGQARAMLCGYYLFAGNHADAIKVGEPFVRNKPPTEHAGTTAIYVMEAYSLALNERAKAGESIEDLAGERAKFRQLIDYVEATWPNDAAGDNARHQLGQLLAREGKPADAVEALSRIKPTYAGIIFSQELLARCALQADEKKIPLPMNEKRTWEQRAFAALESLPELPGGADPSTTAIYLTGKIQHASLLLKNKKYEQVEKMIAPLLDKFEQFKFDSDARRDALRNELGLRKWYAKGTLAENEYNAGHYDKVREMMEPVVAKIKADELTELKPHPQLTRGLLGLAMRAYIQSGQLDKAQEVLPVLQKTLTDEKDDGGTAVLFPVAQLIQDQVRDLKLRGNKDELSKSIDGLTAFLDNLTKQQKEVAPDLARLLAASYSSLDKHDKALALLEKVPEPKGASGKDPDPALVQNYHAVRILRAREYRLDKKLDKANAALKEIQATPWGAQNFEARKESILLLDAEGKHKTATEQWSAEIKRMQPDVDTNGNVKEQYFECNSYYFSAFLKYIQALKDEKKQKTYLRALANEISKLEKSYPDLGGDASRARILAVLEDDSKLKEQYNEIKKAGTK